MDGSTDIWGATKKFGTGAQNWAKKARNFLATGDFDLDTPDTSRENSLAREGFANALGSIYKNRQGEQEFDRQIAQQAADQYARLATQYPELWAAKRKAAFQSGALSALGGT